MLLGENGVGKSSVLKAIALAMMSEKQRRQYAGDARDWVNRGSRAKAGLVRLEFTVGAEPLELHFSRRAPQCTRRGEHPDMAVLGYGSTRLLPPKGKRARAEMVRVQNLFDSRAPLRDAEPWLASPKEVKAGDFDLLASSLKTLLTLADEDRIARRQSRLFARVQGDYGPIRDLSDGYQSVLALAMDMMLNLSHATFDMEGVEGVVLLDELEVHLHPRWKIAIVGALRMLFPRVRFIATTHDPLCVQGIRKGELHIMTRQGTDHDVKIEQFDVPPGARADQILTGAWFGVPTTRDPETVAMMREHSALLQKRSKAPVDEQRFDYLDKQLRQRLDEYIGTEDEQIALQAAADVRTENRARTGTAGADSGNQLREKVLEALRSKPVPQGN
jgi:predicted ATPase